jgi:signal peptidase II
MNKKILNKTALLLIVAVFFIADRFLKFKALNIENQLTLIDNFLYFDFYANYNIALSLPIPNLIALILASLITLLILILIIYLIKKKRSNFLIFSLLFIFMGSVSNILDRINYGYVVDYLIFTNLTVLNIADLMISISSAILIIHFLKEKKE